MWPQALTLAASAGIGALLWTALEWTRGIAANGEHIGPLQPLAIGGVVVALLAVFGGVRTGGGLLVTALSWTIAPRKLVQAPLRLLTLVVVGQAAGTLLAFLLNAPSR